MLSPRFSLIRLFDCKPFHSLLEILPATEISADEIGFTAHLTPLTDRRGKEIAIFLVLFDTAESITLFSCCFQFNYSFSINFFVCLSARTKQNENAWASTFIFLFLAFRQGQRSCSVLPLTESAFSFTLRRRKTKFVG